MVAEAVLADRDIVEPAGRELLRTGERARLLAAVGVVFLLLQFATPGAGLIGIPVNFFLKNRLRLSAVGVATFALWTTIPLYVSFAFGLVRDRWSPLGAGDRGHLFLFGLMTALVYAGLALQNPTYATLVVGVLILNITVSMAWASAQGIAAALGQHHAISGQMGTLINLANWLPAIAAFALGGALSGVMEGATATVAARTLFGIGAALMTLVALTGMLGPRVLFTGVRREAAAPALATDLARLARTWPIWPAIGIQFLWQFGPAMGVALQFHMAQDLHASDAEIGLCYALFYAGLIPGFIAYGLLCQRVRMTRLAWIGLAVSLPASAPLYFAHTAAGFLAAATGLGLMSGFAQAAFSDLAIRVAPEGLQATMMGLVAAMFTLSLTVGSIWGAWLYERGGYATAITAGIVTTAMIIPLLAVIPRRLTATKDGQRPEGMGPIRADSP